MTDPDFTALDKALTDNQLHNELLTTILLHCDVDGSPGMVARHMDAHKLRDALNDYRVKLEARIRAEMGAPAPAVRSSDGDERTT